MNHSLNKVGKWVISKTAESKHLTYINTENGEEWHCGSTAPHIEDEHFIHWMMTVGKPSLGDIICLSTGTSFVFGKSTVAYA